MADQPNPVEGLLMAWGAKSRHERGYDYAWVKRRAEIMKRDCGLCQACKRAGRTTLAYAVDHIVSKAKATALRWTRAQMDDPKNLDHSGERIVVVHLDCSIAAALRDLLSHRAADDPLVTNAATDLTRDNAEDLVPAWWRPVRPEVDAGDRYLRATLTFKAIRLRLVGLVVNGGASSQDAGGSERQDGLEHSGELSSR